MTRHFKTALFATLFAAHVACAGDENVLWWMFDETTEISDINGSEATYTIAELEGRGDAAGKTVNGIRIAAYDGDSLLGYLAIADGDNVLVDYYPMPSFDFDSGEDSWNAGPTYADISPYASTPGVTFMIELGNWDGSLGPGNEWQVLAHSDPETLAGLHDFLDVSDWEMHTTLEWTGGSYSVPEPSSGLLLLIGGAFLALRRRKTAHG